MLINQLSYKNQFHGNLSSSLSRALKKMGIHEKCINPFDAFSTIEIALDTNISIHLEVKDDRVWLWTVFNVVKSKLDENAISILEVLAKPGRHFETGHVVIEFHQDSLLVKAMVNIESIADDCLADALSDYYNVIYPLSAMI